jgi:CHAD domain-containing protein
MYPLTARRALARRLEALSRNLPAAMAGDVESLHRARVASRRLREILAVLTPARGTGPRPGWAKSARQVRKITRALGGVRELDVALGLLDELLQLHPKLTPGVIAARAIVTDERAERDKVMRTEAGDVDLGKLARRLDALVRVPGDSVALAGAPTFGLRDRVRELADRLEASVTAAGALFALDRLHQVRIAAKKLRYALELTEELLRVGTKRAVGRLRGMQDLLGRMHDLAVLTEYVRRAGGAGPGCGGARELAKVIDEDVHGLHAAYLARSRDLAAVVAACRTNISSRMDARAARLLRCPPAAVRGPNA